jgi:hypothetical protein
VKEIHVSGGGYWVSISTETKKGDRWESFSSIYLHSPQDSKTVMLSVPPDIPNSHIFASDSQHIFCPITITQVYPFYVTTDLATITLKPIPIPPDKFIIRIDITRVYFSVEPSATLDLTSQFSIQSTVIPQLLSVDGFSSTVRRLAATVDFLFATNKIAQAKQILADLTEFDQIQAL